MCFDSPRTRVMPPQMTAPPATTSSSPVAPAAAAREGREQQRYDGCYRLVAGCIPYRSTTTETSFEMLNKPQVEVLMISTPKRNDLIFPKGGWENDETMVEAAYREAFEEAGVRGIIDAESLGEWIFKSKSRQSSAGTVAGGAAQEGACKGYMFPLKVTEELDVWPQQAIYRRHWVKVAEAYDLCRYEWMKEGLDQLQEHLRSPETAALALPPAKANKDSSFYVALPPMTSVFLNLKP